MVARWQAEQAAWADALPDALPDAPGRAAFVTVQTAPLTRAIDPTDTRSSSFRFDPALRAAVAACKEKGMTHASVIGRTLPDGQPDLFAYDDYRAYLRDRFDWQVGRVQRRYTKTLFAQGVCSASHLSSVMAGRGHYALNADHVAALAKKWGLSEPRARYLGLLVRYTDCDAPVVRARLRGEMAQIPGYRDARPVDAAVFLALSSLVQLAIYELARTPAFRPDPDWIRGALRTDASREEIGQALLDLVRAGALQEGEDGRLAPNPQPVRQTGEGHRDLQHKLYEDCLDAVERRDGRVLTFTADLDEVTIPLDDPDGRRFTIDLDLPDLLPATADARAQAVRDGLIALRAD